MKTTIQTKTTASNSLKKTYQNDTKPAKNIQSLTIMTYKGSGAIEPTNTNRTTTTRQRNTTTKKHRTKRTISKKRKRNPNNQKHHQKHDGNRKNKTRLQLPKTSIRGNTMTDKWQINNSRVYGNGHSFNCTNIATAKELCCKLNELEKCKTENTQLEKQLDTIQKGIIQLQMNLSITQSDLDKIKKELQI